MLWVTKSVTVSLDITLTPTDNAFNPTVLLILSAPPVSLSSPAQLASNALLPPSEP